jgi:hypothetical protein
MRLWKSNKSNDPREPAASASTPKQAKSEPIVLQTPSASESQRHTSALATRESRVIIDDHGLVKLADQDEALQLAKEKCLRELSGSKYEAQLDRIPVAAPGTCQWLLHHETYSQWRQCQHSSLLWLSADPGCGKSVSARYLVEQFKSKEDQLQDLEVVCYFFFKSDDYEQENSISALRALLHQLYIAQPWLLDHAAKRYLDEPASKRSTMFRDFDTLWSIFESSIRDSTSKHIVLVLDGLDECASLTRSKIIQSLVGFYTDTNNRFNEPPFVKTIVASRDDDGMKLAFDNFPTIRFNGEVEAEAISKDVDLVIKDRINKSVARGFPRDIFDDLETILFEGADRTFLWATVVTEVFEHDRSKQQLQDIVQTRDINQIYNYVLEDTSNEKEARRMLQILVAALRPLTLAELSIAMAVNATQMTFEDLDKDIFRSYEQHVKALCGNFVRIINKTIYLAHQTAREFLLHSPDIQASQTGKWQHSIILREAHSQLLDICLLYLSFLNNATTFTHPSQIPQSDVNPHLFVEYAGRFWTRHYAQVAPELKTNQLARCANLCKPNSRAFKKWFQYAASNSGGPRRGTNEGMIQVDIATYFGLDEVAQLLKQDLKPETVAWVDENAMGNLDEDCKIRISLI